MSAPAGGRVSGRTRRPKTLARLPRAPMCDDERLITASPGSPELRALARNDRATYRPAQSRAMRAARAAAMAALLAAASRALPLAGLEGKEEEAPTASAWLATDDAATDQPDEQGAAGFLSSLQTGCAALCSPLKPRAAPDARHSPNQAPCDTSARGGPSPADSLRILRAHHRGRAGGPYRRRTVRAHRAADGGEFRRPRWGRAGVGAARRIQRLDPPPHHPRVYGAGRRLHARRRQGRGVDLGQAI